MPEAGVETSLAPCLARRTERSEARRIMDWDEAGQAARGIVLGEELSKLSVAELSARITALEAEIARVAAELARKKAHEEAAAALFKR